MDPKIPSTIRAAFVIEGSRGDTQPYLALALKLQQRGNIVRIFTNQDHVSFCKSIGIQAEGVFYSFAETYVTPEFGDALAHGNAFKVLGFLKESLMSSLSDDLSKLWPALESFSPTVLITGILSGKKSSLWSIVNETPIFNVQLQINLPVSDKAPHGLPTLPFGINMLWYWLLFFAPHKKNTRKTKAIAKDTLGIDFNGKFEPPRLHTLMTNVPAVPGPVCIGISPKVFPVHPEWPTENFYPCGFFTLDPKTQETLMKDPSKGFHFGSKSHQALIQFLDEGSAPVYLGWGSMICQSPEWMASLAVEALKHAGERGVVLGGWAGLSQNHVPEHLVDFCKENVLFVESANHEWLFSRCSCIVHHGGSGTTAASLRSGKPTIITPCFLDQYGFADGINDIGCGVGLDQMRRVTGSLLGSTIRRCLGDEGILERARTTGVKLREEDGCAIFCSIFDEWLANEYNTGEWLRKHKAMLQECEEYWKRQQEEEQSSCIIS